MSKFARAILIFLLLAAVCFSAPATYRDGVVLVGFNPGVTESQKASAFAVIGAAEIKRIGVGVHVIRVGPGRVLGAIQLLKARGEIRYAEPDYEATLAGAVPNDPSFGLLWAAQNTAQRVNGSPATAGADERLVPAWSMSTGANSVVVAVPDSGVQFSHPDLLTNMWTNTTGLWGCAAGTHGYNVLTGVCDPMDDDTFFGGHGTHVSGILGAVGNNGAGVVGVNWTTSIMALKWFPGNNAGVSSDLVTALDKVVQAKQAGVNVRVVNVSATWPGDAYSQALSDEIDLLGTNDILFVTAAGNTAQNNDVVPRYPCSYNRANEICVAATDQTDALWVNSNYGVTTVQLAAPGTDIYSTKRQSDYGYISGTSMAAPQVAGTAALILSFGYQSVANLKSIILNSVDPLPSLTGFVSTGGRLNTCKAIPGCTTAVTARPGILQAPVVTSVPQSGSVLGASTGQWSGAPTQFSYQWYRCNSSGASCAAITGATSQAYATLASADAGSTLRVTVTASNTAGSSSAQSAASAPVAVAASPFTLTSTIQDGQNLGGTVSWQVTSTQTLNFLQFYIDGVLSQTDVAAPYTYNQATTGTLDTSTLSPGTHVLGVRALSSDNETYGFYGATISVGNVPVNTGLPMLSGTPSPGQTLSTTNGTWTNNPTSFSYQWKRCDASGANCVNIAGASAATYLVAGTDAGSTIRSTVTATNGIGSSSATSAQVVITGGGGGGGGAIAQVQSNAVEGTAVGSVSVPFSSANTAGNLIVAFVRMSTTSQTVTVSDTAGNTYADAVSQAQTTDGHQIHIFYAKNIFAGANTVTATFSATNNHPWLAVYEYSGLNTTNPLDRTASAQGSDASPNTGATATTANANELVFAATGLVNGFTGTAIAGSGFTLQQQDTGTSRAATESLLASATGAFAGSFTLSAPTNWSAVVATFSAAGGSAPTTPTITTTSLPGGTQNSAYTGQLAASGGATPYSWSITTGALPTGLTLAAVTGAISGTPTASGTFNFTVQVRDANTLTASKALSITISAAATPPTITTTSLPGGTQNSAYTGQLAASGGVTPYSWSITNGALPTGLTLTAATGAISGTPTATGTFSFTVQVRDANALTASKALSITVNPAATGWTISLLQSNSVEGTAVGSVSVAFPSANTAGNLIVAFVRMSSTSQTVSVTDTAGNAYADAVSQAQTTDGHQIHIFYAKNIAGGANTVTARFSSTNNHPWLAIYEYSGLNTTNPLDRTAAAQGSDASPNTGLTATTASGNELVFAGTGFVNSFAGTATAGSGFTMQQQDAGTSRAATETALAGTTGAFAGTFALSAATNWSAVVATFTAGSGSMPAPPTITTASLSGGTVNSAYSALLAASGGATPYSWSITTGALPAGLTLAAATGAISGTPSASGTFNFTVQVRDANALTASKALSITISAAATPPTVTTTSLPAGTQNSAYTGQLAASGGATPYSWLVTAGALPSGLTLSGTTGAISGSPTATGTFNFTVQVTDANSLSATKALSIVISPAGSGGGIALVQSNAVEGTAVNSVATPFPAPNTAGNLIIAFVRMSTATQTVTVTDSAGNVYSDAVSQAQTTDGHQIHIFYAKNVAGRANTVTATFSSTNNHPWLAVYEYRGLSTTSPLDRVSQAQGGSASVSTAATAVTSSANELVFSGAGFVNNYTGTATAGSGFAMQQQDTGTSRAATETTIATAANAFTGSFALSAPTNWSAVIATFK